MPTHAYIDESHRQTYLLCAVVLFNQTCATHVVPCVRYVVLGQRRVHMYHESDRRRRHILTAVGGLPVAAHLVQGSTGNRSERTVRDDCLRVLVPGLAMMAVERIVVESCGQDHQDNQIIRDAVSKLPDDRRPAYLHASPAAEPLLWLPDIVGWAYGRGGDWRRRVPPIVDEVTHLLL